MSIFDGIGTIREFYLDQLEYSNTINEPDFLVNAAAQVLKKYGGKNWVPIIIKNIGNIGEDKYEVIGNSFVYTVAKAAKLEKILCIVIESTNEAEEISKILSKEILPKINLSIANKDEIKATFKYLKSQSNSPLSKITASSIESIANRIVNSNRQYWTNLTPLGNLGTNLIKENLEFISTVFYFTPIPPPPPPKINLSIANRDQIIEGLEFLKKERKLNIDVLDASTKLEQAEKKYWIDYKGVLDLKIKVTANKLDDFKSVFSLKPELLELPNNIDTLPIKKLKEIVKKMGLFIKTSPAQKDYIEAIQKNINSLLNTSEGS
jgi:hypothetical protein